MMTDIPSAQGGERDAAWRARGIAATLGEFDPTQLLDPTKEDDLASLGKLATECNEIVKDGRTRWILKPDVRSRVFKEVARDDLLQLIEGVGPAGGDEFGRLLQDILRNGPTVAQIPTTDLGLLRTALRFIGPALGMQAADQASQQVELQLSRNDADQAVQVLLPRQLVGRNAELAKLRRYVRATSGRSAEDIFWITGVGGSGKSALLGEFARTLRGDDWSGTPVLQLDFDRPAFYRGTLTILMVELSRQLELHFPNMQPALSAYRRATRSGASAAASVRYSNFENAASAANQASSAWQFEMRDHLPIDRKLVLILDTAEEIGLSSDFDLEGLRSWLRQLRTREGLPNLRVVLSGRAFHADQLALVPSQQQLALGDLGHNDAVALLKSLVEMKNAPGDFPLTELVEMLGGNPLSLKILANHLAEGGEEAASELLADRSGFDRRFAQAFLYRRILGRLRTEDQDLVKIAHPGLLLRRVTPFLIQHVLAAPCELGSLDEVRSRLLFQQLAGQVWLVQGTANPDVVIHRRDLRRLMLQAMTAEDNVRALAIHQAAADYYGQERDPFMTREEQAVEGYYHALFAPDAAVNPDLDMLEAVARTLGEDLDTVPTLPRARFKLALSRELSSTELQVLPSTDVGLYRSLQQRKALKGIGKTRKIDSFSAPRVAAGSDTRLFESELHAAFEIGDLDGVRRAAPAAALAFAESLRRGGTRKIDSFSAPRVAAGSDTRLFESELHAAFESGDLHGVRRAAPAAALAFAESLWRGGGSNYSDLTESPVWRAALASMGRKDLVVELLKIMPKMGWQDWSQSVGERSYAKLTGGDVFRMLFRLHGADCPAPFLPEPSYRSSRLFLAQDLRRFQLIDEPGGELVEIPVRLLRDLATDFVDFFADSKREDVISADSQARADLALLRTLRVRGEPVTLSNLDRLGNSEGSLLATKAADLPRQVKDILVGRLPEIHVLVRVAARKCPTRVLVDFAAEAARNPLWPVELGPSQLRERLADERERWTATLITVADRFGLLRRFIDWLEDRGRLKGRPLMLLRTVRDYELRLRQFM